MTGGAGTPIRVVVVDDQPLVRTGIAALLGRSADIVVVAEAADGAAGVRAIREHRPDVALMDLMMPGTDGVTAIREIAGSGLPCAVLALTTFDTDELVFGALRAGAVGFLLKDTAPDELRAAIRAAATGQGTLAPAVTSRVIAAATAAPAADRSVLAGLTEREIEVLAEVGTGAGNEEIGARLYMSGATARTHVGRILSKLQVRDRAGLVVVAHRAGLVPAPADPAPGRPAAHRRVLEIEPDGT
ncbi:response regulator [Nakamurella sp. YIM 132087]|uniref:Response regulator n=1 Tax=Nakamurella alba TaxID=2665158 RepID=A0A7K1FR38_9ACTN|nr:response regulator transcription factor [Nakamurella alba]MTD16607.1 response regulator [Nakamurella alba]